MKEKLLKIKDKIRKIFSKYMKKIKLFIKTIRNNINKFIKKLVKNNKNNKKNNKKDNKNKKKNKKLDYKSLTVSQIESELKKTKYKNKYFNILRSTIYSLIIITSIALIVATLVMPVFQISTNSLNDYNSGDIVVSLKTKNIRNGDVIAFYHGNKILVKRVIATSGSWIVIDGNQILVDGKIVNNINLKDNADIEYSIEMPYQVPDGSWFVLSDDIDDMVDSRNGDIGCVTRDNIIGKILFRIWPLKK